jgi:hypothetical protein
VTAKREAIFALIEQRLIALTSAVEVERMASGDPSAFPSLNIEDGTQKADPEMETGVTHYALTIAIEGFVAGGNGPEAHAAASALYVECVTALLTEPPLDGLAYRIEEGEARFAVALLSDERRIGFVCEFIVEFVADRLSPTHTP